jgi:hypothetical protein
MTELGGSRNLPPGPVIISPAAVQAQVPACGRVPIQSLYDPFCPYGGCAPGSAPWEYDTGGNNDRFPERPRYQQGGGQQTGGPARNLIPAIACTPSRVKAAKVPGVAQQARRAYKR